jgi:ComF family protein
MARVSTVACALARLLAPDRCPGCDLVLCSAVPGFCPACAPLLELSTAVQRAPALAAAAYVYCGPLADAICRLKYAARTELAPILGALLAEAALAYAGRVDRVLALPLHPARLRERGFNQSALLARPVARALGVALDVHSLRRIRPTCDQASLPRERRADNVRGAFVAVRRPAVDRVLLIDDVRTTGATLAAAGEALLEAGYGEVRTLALARAES